MEDVQTVITQFHVLGSVWVPFLVCLIASGCILYWIMNARFKDRIDSTEARLKLRDDRLAELERERSRAPITALIADRDQIADVKTKTGESSSVASTADERTYLPPDMSANRLTGLVKGRTSVQAEAALQPFIDKWFKVTGQLSNVSRLSGRLYSMYLNVDKDTDDELERIVSRVEIYAYFYTNFDSLDVLSLNQTITIVGQVKDASTNTIRLDHCEMVQAA